MFTKEELNVLQAALRCWRGPYGENAKLTDDETDRRRKMLEIADSMATRFEAILYHYFEMENTSTVINR